MKNFYFAVVFLLYSHFSFSQQFSQGIGLGTYVQGARDFFTNAATLGIVYEPRLAIPIDKHFSVSVASALSVGGINISGSGSRAAGYSGNFFYADVPLFFDFNFGAGSSRENRNNAGIFIGGGIAYHYLASTRPSQTASAPGHIDGIGPLVNTGVRFAMLKHRHFVETKFGLQSVKNNHYSQVYSTSATYFF